MEAIFPVCILFQLHLQRNEVIALINLLNRLSESVMLVHDMGPSLENVMRTQISTPSDQPLMTGGAY